MVTRIPLIGPLAKKVNAARTARTLSSLLSSGVDIVEALGITRDVVQNSYYKEVLEGAQKVFKKELSFHARFRKRNICTRYWSERWWR